MPSRRMERINELLLQEIARVVRERQDPEVGFVTFTGVTTSDDLAQARVFYSVLGSEEDRGRTAEALNHMRHELTRNMRRLESLRRIPAFEFVYDETPERAARVFELIEKIHHEEEAGPPPSKESQPGQKPPAMTKPPDARPQRKKTR